MFRLTPHRDKAGHRIAEYDTDTLIREYIWLEDRPLAVIEGGALYYLHVDHIGRPVMATDDTATVVWQARYTPFGGIDAIITDLGEIEQDLRFPGQWFQVNAASTASPSAPQTASGGAISR